MLKIFQNKSSKILLRIIGVILFLIILTKINLSLMLNTLLNANFFYIFTAMIVAFFVLLIKAYRWQLLMIKQDINISLLNSILVYSASLYHGIITPGRIGEFSKILYLKKYGYRPEKSLVSVLIDRVVDLIIFAAMVFIGMIYFSEIFFSELRGIIYILLLILIVFIILILNKSFWMNLVRRMLTILLPKKYKAQTANYSKQFLSELRKISFSGFATAIILTIVSQLLYFGMGYLLALAINMKIELIYLAISMTLGQLVSMLPISIAGMGTRDITFITLFELVSISSETAIAYSMMLLLMTIFLTFIGVFSDWKLSIDN